jgi:hypothetical protein
LLETAAAADKIDGVSVSPGRTRAMASTAEPGEPVDLFISYAHVDEPAREALEKHLSLLKARSLVRVWHDRRIAAGDDFSGAISEHLDTARIILLLVSADFLASDYCGLETRRALERQKAGDARVIPVIFRPCDWHHGPFGHLQAVPRDGKPVVDWPSQDQALRDVAAVLRKIIEQETRGLAGGKISSSWAWDDRDNRGPVAPRSRLERSRWLAPPVLVPLALLPLSLAGYLAWQNGHGRQAPAGPNGAGPTAQPYREDVTALRPEDFPDTTVPQRASEEFPLPKGHVDAECAQWAKEALAAPPDQVAQKFASMVFRNRSGRAVTVWRTVHTCYGRATGKTGETVMDFNRDPKGIPLQPGESVEDALMFPGYHFLEFKDPVQPGKAQPLLKDWILVQAGKTYDAILSSALFTGAGPTRGFEYHEVATGTR